MSPIKNEQLDIFDFDTDGCNHRNEKVESAKKIQDGSIEKMIELFQTSFRVDTSVGLNIVKNDSELSRSFAVVTSSRFLT